MKHSIRFFSLFLSLTFKIYLFFFSNISFAQFHIAPSIGLSHHILTEQENFIYFQINQQANTSLSYGLRAEFPVSAFNFISLTSHYQNKHIKAGDIGFIPFTHLSYKSLNSTLQINRIIREDWHIGLGLNYMYIPQIDKSRNNFVDRSFETLYPIFGKIHNIGAIASLGYTYKNIDLEFDYSLSFYNNVFGHSSLIDNISFIQLHLSYLINTTLKLSKNQIYSKRYQGYNGI